MAVILLRYVLSTDGARNLTGEPGGGVVFLSLLVSSSFPCEFILSFRNFWIVFVASEFLK